MAISIKSNIESIKQKISCHVQIVAASKYADSSQIKEAYGAGIEIFGENRVQDLLQKQKELPDLPVEWHFIGHLQTNKVNKIVGKVGLIHSVDSLDLAQKISKRAQHLGIEQLILMQVNISSEPTKSGFEPDKSLQMAKKIAMLKGISLAGLMTMAPNVSEAKIVDDHFNLARQKFDKIKAEIGEGFKWLSMGMSNDFELAIKHGANMLRLGSVIFR